MKMSCAYDLLVEVLKNHDAEFVLEKLSIHKGTFNRWIQQKKVPQNYYNDLNALLCKKYPAQIDERAQDQFFTKKETAAYCFAKMCKVLKNLEIKIDDYFFIEPSAGCCNFFRILPQECRIGIDIEPKSELKGEILKMNYLDFSPDKSKKYIVIGNPPFGLRGNLALRFINHSASFADVVAFILPPLFDSTGKGVPMKRVKGFRLAHSEKLKSDSFEYPNGENVEIETIFQVWTKINCEKIEIRAQKTCKSFLKVYSLSDGGTPASTRNKKMLKKCDVYLPSTCFSGMAAYDDFEKLPNRRGYGVVFLRQKEILKNLYFQTEWRDVAFFSTNHALNLRTSLIESVAINAGFFDENLAYKKAI